MRIKINGQSYSCNEGDTVLRICKQNGIRIPTLCGHPDLLPSEGVCRMCLVETNRSKCLVASCTQKVCEGLEVQTETDKINRARKVNLELLWVDHAGKCAQCKKNGRCELQNLAKEYDPDEFKFVPRRKELKPADELDLLKDNWAHTVFDDANPCLSRDSQYCVECRRCVRICRDIQTIESYGVNYRSSETNVGTPHEKPLDCIFCGQCSVVCPTAAIVEKDETEKMEAAIADPHKLVVVQVAPSVRFTFPEEFGQIAGNFWEGKLVAALKKLGVDKIFDTTLAADLTIMEESHELMARIKSGKNMPMFTSCCPSWVLYAEKYWPEYIPNLSSCKSPQQMLGALLKTYWAKKEKIHPENIFSVSVMPCTSKKYEAQRPEMRSSGCQDVDLAITVRELARFLRRKKIDPAILEDEKFDPALGISTGAGILFGQSGGVMEAALRTTYETVSGKELPKIEFANEKNKAYRTAEMKLGNKKIKMAIAHEIGNAKKLLEELKSGKAHFDFVEVMACPNGCIGGGGNPQPSNQFVRDARIKAVKERDKNMPLRKSHENPAVKKIYKEFLGAPGGKKSEELLHTKYMNRKK